MSKKGKIILISLGLLLIIALSLPVRFPHTIRTLGSIVPAKEWILRRGEQGNLMATIHNHVSGLIEEYSNSDVQRGDVFRFRMNPRIQGRNWILAGDTVGIVESSILSRNLISLQGDLGVARSSLYMEASGDKASIVKELEEKKQMAHENLILQNHITRRQDSLFIRNLISYEEAEIARSNLRTAEIQARIADYQLQNVLEGVKPERIEMLESQIRATEHEVKTIQDQSAILTFISPLSGSMHRYFQGDTLLIVGDTSTVVMMMVPWEKRQDLAMGQQVRARITGYGRFNGRIIRIENTIDPPGAAPRFLAVALLEAVLHDIPAHLMVNCTIVGNQTNIRQRVLNFLKVLFR